MNKHLLLICSILIVILSSCASVFQSKAPIIYDNKDNIESKDIGRLISYQTKYSYYVNNLTESYHSFFCANLNKYDCRRNIKNIKNAPGFGGFDLSSNPISNNKLGIKQIEGVKLQYLTKGVFGEKRQVSGFVFMPQIDSNKIKGVVLFFHPTLLSKYNVPSYNVKHPENILLASIFASQGYIVVAPDYIGMGDDMNVPHPYIAYPEANTTDGLSMLKAFRNYLIDSKIDLADKNLKLFVTGYSEGGAYALWFSKLAQNNKMYSEILSRNRYNLNATVGVSGAYDLSNITVKWLYSNVNGRWFSNPYNTYNSLVTSALKPALLADFLISYSYYNRESDYATFFNPEFFNMTCTWSFASSCRIENKKYNLSQIFNVDTDDLNIGLAAYKSASFKVGNGKFYSLFSNDIAPLVVKDFTKDKQFINFIKQADIYDWYSKSPVTLVYLKQDSTVTNLNAIKAYNAMKLRNSNVRFVKFDNDLLKSRNSFGFDEGTDHVNGFYYLLIPALTEFERYK